MILKTPRGKLWGNLNAMNRYFYIRSLNRAVPMHWDREYARYPFKGGY